jgi:hypothetical protein
MAFRVVRCTPRWVAAVVTTPPLSRSTRMTCSRSTCSRVVLLAIGIASGRISAKGARRLGPLERMTERSMKFSSFPYVPRPMPAHKSAHRLRRDLVNLPAHFPGVFLGEVPGEDRYVLRVIPQRRCRRDRENFQPIVEIASEKLTMITTAQSAAASASTILGHRTAPPRTVWPTNCPWWLLRAR